MTRPATPSAPAASATGIGGCDPGVPLVTVGMPVHNGEQWLEDAIDSILSQTYTNLLLIISDNASTDGTSRICKRYVEKDDRVRYWRNDVNIGVFKNYNRVFELSSTRYFKWASCNDVCGPRFLEACIDVLERDPEVVLAYPKAALFDGQIENAESYDDDLDLSQNSPSARLKALLSSLRLNNMYNGVMRSDVLRTTPLNKVHTGSDINLIAEVVLHGKFAKIRETLFFRRMNPAASSIMVPASKRAEYFADEPRDVLAFRLWKIDMGFFSALRRVAMPLGEKLKIAAYLAQRLFQNRASLLREFSAALRSRRAKAACKQAGEQLPVPDASDSSAATRPGRNPRQQE